MVDPEAQHEGRLRALAQLESEGARTVQNAGASHFERSQERQTEGDGAGIAPDVSAGARLVEVQPGARQIRGIESVAFEVVGGERCAAAFQGRKQGLLPFRMFVDHDEVGRHAVVCRLS
jgi:hypothetical protein